MKLSGVITNDRSDIHANGQGQRSKVKVTEVKIQFRHFRTVTPVKFTYGDEMMHKDWCGIGEMPYCFSRSSIEFQGRTAKKNVDLTQIGRFRTVTPFWIHRWLWNDAQPLK